MCSNMVKRLLLFPLDVSLRNRVHYTTNCNTQSSAPEDG